jgi:hypothetical protein
MINQSPFGYLFIYYGNWTPREIGYKYYIYMSLEIYKIKNIWDRGGSENDGVSDLKGEQQEGKMQITTKIVTLEPEKTGICKAPRSPVPAQPSPATKQIVDFEFRRTPKATKSALSLSLDVLFIPYTLTALIKLLIEGLV